MVRLLGKAALSLLIIALIVGAVAGLILFLGREQSAVTEMLQARFQERPALLASRRANVVWTLVLWAAWAGLWAFIWVVVWLFSADRVNPDGERQAKCRRPLWIVLLLVALGLTALSGWWIVFGGPAATDLAPWMLYASTALIGIAIPLAFFAATGGLVKYAMLRSVPGYGLLSLMRKK